MCPSNSCTVSVSRVISGSVLGTVLAAKCGTEEDSLLRTKHSLVASKMSHFRAYRYLISGIELVEEGELLCLS